MASSKITSTNSLITTKAPDTPLSVQLHPLVLLTISDYITRHASRQQEGLIVGAIIGQQNGRNFTLEHAFEVKTVEADGKVIVDGDWFGERMEQYRDVHKEPALDLVGVFMLGSVQGPSEAHLGLVRHVQQVVGTDSVMLLLFHPEMVNELQGGKLPITLYESVSEAVEGGEGQTKFRELAFEVETSEAEMISVDYVASGAGNATAVQKAADTTAGAEPSNKKSEGKTKGKGKAKDSDTNGVDEAGVLSAEDEELIASLTAKANAIKMLNQRINLIRQYLSTLPPSYLTDANTAEAPPIETNHALLRSINAMLSRLPLLSPPQPTPPSTTSLPSPPSQTGQDKHLESVHLTSLLSSLTRSLNEAQNLSAKFAVVQRERQNKGPGGGGGGAFKGGPPGKFVGFGEEGGFMGGEAGAGF